jgi:hypothetical protein
MKKMKAKYKGCCGGCGGYISVGQEIVWTKLLGAYHIFCAPNKKIKRK